MASPAAEHARPRSSADAAVTSTAAPGHRSGTAGAGHHDGGLGLALQAPQLIECVLQGLARRIREFLQRVLHRGGVDVELQRQRAAGRHQAGMALVDHRPAGVIAALRVHRHHPAQGSGAPVGEALLAVEVGGVELDFG